MNDTKNANISTMNDLGALLGTPIIAHLSDLTYRKRTPIVMVTLILSCLIFYLLFIDYYKITYAKLLIAFFFYGMFSSTVGNTIVGIASADIGNASGMKNSKAVSTITGIIDGTGGIGSAIGQFSVGAMENAWGWRYGYLLLVAVVNSLTIIPLSIILKDEIKDIKAIRAHRKLESYFDQNEDVNHTASCTTRNLESTMTA